MSREQLTEMEQKLKAAIGPRCVANARIRHLFEASRMFRIALPIPVPRSRSQVGGKANPGKCNAPWDYKAVNKRDQDNEPEVFCPHTCSPFVRRWFSGLRRKYGLRATVYLAS